MQDYIVFGHGYEGEVRQDDDNLDIIRIVSKPIVMKAGDIEPPGANLQFFHIRVNVINFQGYSYNVASNDPISQEELKRAIMQENPKPVIRRV